MKSAAYAFVALLALATVAQTAEAAFCRTSSYKVKAVDATNNKLKMYGNCKAQLKLGAPTIYKPAQTMADGCVLIFQKVASAEAWDAYSACEKSAANAQLYGPLKAQSKPCEKYAAKGSC